MNEVMLTDLESLRTYVNRYKESMSLLHEVMSFKVKIFLSLGIQKLANNPYCKFTRESMVKAEKQLRKVHESVKKT